MTTTFDATTVQTLQNAVYAYIDTYHPQAELPQVRAIAGAIVTARAKAGELVAPGLTLEAWVDAVAQGFDPSRVGHQVWQEGEKAIATQAKTWRDTLETKARATLDAYIQHHQPNIDVTPVQSLLTTVLPIVEDGPIASDEAKRLMRDISSQFDWQTAASRVIDPKWITLAGKVAKCVQNHDVEGTVQDVMQAYIAKFQPQIADIGTSLAEEALSAVLNSQGILDIDIDLDAESQHLVVQQVSFKLNLMAASPSPSKTALAIAQQVHDEVARYRAQQGMDQVSTLPPVITTDDSTSSSSLLGGEMSIGIEIHKAQD